jgi:hypothetical protein
MLPDGSNRLQGEGSEEGFQKAMRDLSITVASLRVSCFEVEIAELRESCDKTADL